MTGKERAALRAQAHHLQPVVLVGAAGITPAVEQSLNEALTARELVKISVAKGGSLKAKEAAPVLAERTGAEVIQVIGRTCTLYRKKPDVPRE